MANLIAPGVDVQITTETSYTSSTAGTVPLIVIATASNKESSAGNGAVAPYTTDAYANSLYLATSQRDLLQKFGLPTFRKSSNGTPLHGYELNEYGLHGAYKYLGIWNQAYILRADLDLNQLVPSVSHPNSAPTAGTYWLDLSATSFGVFVSNGNSLPGSAWVSKSVTIINDVTQIVVVGSLSKPIDTIGANGDIAVVTVSEDNRFWQKVGGTWVEVGSVEGQTVYRTNNASYPAGSHTGDVWIKGAAPNKGANYVVRYYNGTSGAWVVLAAPLYPFNSSLVDGDTAKDASASAGFGARAIGTVYVGYDATLKVQYLRRWNGTKWENLSYVASATEPHNPPVDGTLWYNTDLKVDVMVGNGQNWEGYRNRYPLTDPEGVIVSGSAPVQQTDGTALVDNDIWLNGSDLENYPALYRFTASTGKWTALDLTDSTTPFGIVFADARADTGIEYDGIESGIHNFNSTAIADLLVSNYVDPDAPNAELHPDGVLLFNLRYSTYNVKKWVSEYFKAGGFDPNTDFTTVSYTNSKPETYAFAPVVEAGRWVTVSGLKANGAPYMGRKAQRIMVVTALSKAINSNNDVSSSQAFFNLITAPGYPELLEDLVVLNTAQNEVAFIIGDTPARLNPSGTSIQNWATNAYNATSTGDEGLTTANEYCAVYYPWSMSKNVDGSSVVVPPSTIALTTYAYNDQVAYPWLAPAGTQRGKAIGVDSVGYINADGAYQTVMLNGGQLATMYGNNINPIEYLKGSGFVFMGQKTLAATPGPTDRVNNARLACYLKYNLDILVKPFLFATNNVFTRDAAHQLVSNFLAGLVSLNAISDFAVLCDLSNNTSDRQNLHQLWIDIAVMAYDAVEFIYVPVRMVAQGSSLALA